MPSHVVIRGARRASTLPVFTGKSYESRDDPTFSFSADWNDPAGWMGRALVQRELYPDANAVSTSMPGRLLQDPRAAHGAPVRGQRRRSRRDESGSHSRARCTFPPGDSRFSTAGIYAPYYTPASLSYQSVIGAVALRPSPDVTLRGGGGYAIRARTEVRLL